GQSPRAPKRKRRPDCASCWFLVCPQGLRRLNRRRSASRHPTCDERGQGEREGCGNNDSSIKTFSERERREKRAAAHANPHKPQRLPEHHPDDVGGSCAERDADSELAGPQRDEEGDDT